VVPCTYVPCVPDPHGVVDWTQRALSTRQDLLRDSSTSPPGGEFKTLGTALACLEAARADLVCLHPRCVRALCDTDTPSEVVASVCTAVRVWVSFHGYLLLFLCGTHTNIACVS